MTGQTSARMRRSLARVLTGVFFVCAGLTVGTTSASAAGTTSAPTGTRSTPSSPAAFGAAGADDALASLSSGGASATPHRFDAVSTRTPQPPAEGERSATRRTCTHRLATASAASLARAPPLT